MWQEDSSTQRKRGGGQPGIPARQRGPPLQWTSSVGEGSLRKLPSRFGQRVLSLPLLPSNWSLPFSSSLLFHSCIPQKASRPGTKNTRPSFLQIPLIISHSSRSLCAIPLSHKLLLKPFSSTVSPAPHRPSPALRQTVPETVFSLLHLPQFAELSTSQSILGYILKPQFPWTMAAIIPAFPAG